MHLTLFRTGVDTNGKGMYCITDGKYLRIEFSLKYTDEISLTNGRVKGSEDIAGIPARLQNDLGIEVYYLQTFYYGKMLMREFKDTEKTYEEILDRVKNVFID